MEGHDEARRMTHIQWFGTMLEAGHAPQFAVGARVAWSIPASHIVLHRRDRPSRGERENPVFGQIVRCVLMGEMTAVALRVVAGERTDLYFSVPTHVAQRNGLASGETARVSLLSDGIHLMPAASTPTPPSPG